MRIEEMETRKLQSEMNIDALPINSKHLFEQLCTEKKLLEGWCEVKRNRGTSGNDGQTVEEFETRLHEEIKQLKKELLEWKYEPQPVRRVEIPKPESKTEVRELGVVVQT